MSIEKDFNQLTLDELIERLKKQIETERASFADSFVPVTNDSYICLLEETHKRIIGMKQTIDMFEKPVQDVQADAIEEAMVETAQYRNGMTFCLSGDLQAYASKKRLGDDNGY